MNSYALVRFENGGIAGMAVVSNETEVGLLLQPQPLSANLSVVVLLCEVEETGPRILKDPSVPVNDRSRKPSNDCEIFILNQRSLPLSAMVYHKTPGGGIAWKLPALHGRISDARGFYV